MNIEKPTYLDYLATLSDVSGIKVDSFASLCEALKNRMDFFASMGCSVSDHGLEYVMYAPASAETVESIFANVLVELPSQKRKKSFSKQHLWFLLEKSTLRETG